MTEQRVAAPVPDAGIIERLLAGDETTFMLLVDQHQPAMLRLAQLYVPSRAVAEEVVQEAWLGILKGLPAFEGRSSLRTLDVQDRHQHRQDARGPRGPHAPLLFGRRGP